MAAGNYSAPAITPIAVAPYAKIDPNAGMQALIAVQKALAQQRAAATRAAGGGGGGGGGRGGGNGDGLNPRYTNYVDVPLGDGKFAKVPVQGADQKSRAAGEKAVLNQAIKELAANDEGLQKSLADIGKLSLPGQKKELERLRKEYIPQMVKRWGLGPEVGAELAKTYTKEAADNVKTYKEAIDNTSVFSTLAQGAKLGLNKLVDAFRGLGASTEEKLNMGLQREAEAAQIRAENPYLEDMHRRMMEGNNSVLGDLQEHPMLGAANAFGEMLAGAGSIMGGQVAGGAAGAGLARLAGGAMRAIPTPVTQALGTALTLGGTALGGAVAGAPQGGIDLIDRLAQEVNAGTMSREDAMQAIDRGEGTAQALTGAISAIPFMGAQIGTPFLSRSAGTMIGRRYIGNQAAKAETEKLAAQGITDQAIVRPQVEAAARNAVADATTAYNASGALGRWGKSIVPTAVDLGALGAGSTMAQNYAYNEATGKDIPITQGAGTAFMQGAVMGPVFGAMNAFPRHVPEKVKLPEQKPETPAAPETARTPDTTVENIVHALENAAPPETAGPAPQAKPVSNAVESKRIVAQKINSITPDANPDVLTAYIHKILETDNVSPASTRLIVHRSALPMEQKTFIRNVIKQWEKERKSGNQQAGGTGGGSGATPELAGIGQGGEAGAGRANPATDSAAPRGPAPDAANAPDQLPAGAPGLNQATQGRGDAGVPAPRPGKVAAPERVAQEPTGQPGQNANGERGSSVPAEVNPTADTGQRSVAPERGAGAGSAGTPGASGGQQSGVLNKFRDSPGFPVLNEAERVEISNIIHSHLDAGMDKTQVLAKLTEGLDPGKRDSAYFNLAPVVEIIAAGREAETRPTLRTEPEAKPESTAKPTEPTPEVKPESTAKPTEPAPETKPAKPAPRPETPISREAREDAALSAELGIRPTDTVAADEKASMMYRAIQEKLDSMSWPEKANLFPKSTGDIHANDLAKRVLYEHALGFKPKSGTAKTLERLQNEWGLPLYTTDARNAVWALPKEVLRGQPDSVFPDGGGGPRNAQYKAMEIMRKQAEGEELTPEETQAYQRLKNYGVPDISGWDIQHYNSTLTLTEPRPRARKDASAGREAGMRTTEKGQETITEEEAVNRINMGRNCES